MIGRIAFALFLGMAVSLSAESVCARSRLPHGKLHTYFIAADEVDWDYAPSGIDMMMGMKFQGYARLYTDRGAHLIGKVYRKAIYREYTDATFTRLKPRPVRDAYLGILGPVIRCEVGDTIKVVFKNNGTHPYSVHPHGVFYRKNSEGSDYNDGVGADQKAGGSVAPGKTYTYIWEVPARAGPGPSDGSSILWLYHSHVEERRDVNAGLIGTIVVTRRGMARPDGTPKDVDKEFVTLFMTFDENQSWFVDDNIRRFAGDPRTTNRLDMTPSDPSGHFDNLLGTGMGAANFRFTINGYQFANMPMLTMRNHTRVRWYLATIGEADNVHTPHWHGNTVLVQGRRADVIALSPAQTVTADMTPDNPGIWLFHCHVSDHMEGGMAARYQVLR